MYKVIIPFDATKKWDEFKGYALVTFHDPTVVQNVLNFPKHVILGRRVIFIKNPSKYF